MRNRANLGMTGRELLVVLAIVAALLVVIVYRKLTYEHPVHVSRVRSDHRSLATAIETYYIDYNEYPAMTMRPEDTNDYTIYRDVPDKVGRTFVRAQGDLISLTTPIAYITSIFPDPFADTPGTGFRYYCDGRGWMLGSFGPDVDEETGGQLMWDRGDINVGTKIDDGYTSPVLEIDGVEAVYSSRLDQPSDFLLTGAGPNGAFTYDPTNGSISPGDAWRVKQ